MPNAKAPKSNGNRDVNRSEEHAAHDSPRETVTPSIHIGALAQTEIFVSMSDVSKALTELGFNPMIPADLNALVIMAEEEAGRLLAVATDSDIFQLQKYIEAHPPSALTIAMLLKKVAANAGSAAISEQARRWASRPHKKDRRDQARGYWDRWQANPLLYENKTAFCSDMQEKCEISERTARKWMKSFENEDLLKRPLPPKWFQK